MSKKISGAEYPLSKIFSSDFEYIIPSYQRPYAWTVDQSSELFDDLYDFFLNEQEDTYFLGSIVLIKEEGNPRSEVIDGQQRLTTLTILLSSLGYLASEEYEESLKKYLCEPGNEIEQIAPKPRVSLRERDKEFFNNYIQLMNFDALSKLDSAQLTTESQRNIQTNANLFIQRIKSAVSNDSAFIKKFASFLVLRCFLVVVSTPNQQSAFRVFSVLNNRGLDLLPTDIIKSNVIGQITSDKKQNEFNEKWEELEVQTGRNGFTELFSHIRMIYAKTKAKRSLLEEFNEHVLLKKNVSSEDLINKVIEPYAEAYLVAKNCQFISTANAESVNALLKWLNRIDNSDWLPPAIFFLAQHKNSPEYVFWFFKKLERLAAYMHICGKNVNERIQRYVLVIEALEQPNSFESPIKAIELTLNEQDEMKSALNGNIYWLTARRRNYLILRLDAFLSDAAASYDPNLLTIEHVLPQTVDSNSEWAKIWPTPQERDEWIHRIANLVPLTQKRNSQAQNYDFDKKKTAYFGGKQGISSYALTTQVLNTKSWAPDDVRNRQKDLLEVLADRWELLTGVRLLIGDSPNEKYMAHSSKNEWVRLKFERHIYDSWSMPPDKTITNILLIHPDGQITITLGTSSFFINEIRNENIHLSNDKENEIKSILDLIISNPFKALSDLKNSNTLSHVGHANPISILVESSLSQTFENSKIILEWEGDAISFSEDSLLGKISDFWEK